MPEVGSQIGPHTLGTRHLCHRHRPPCRHSFVHSQPGRRGLLPRMQREDPVHPPPAGLGCAHRGLERKVSRGMVAAAGPGDAPHDGGNDDGRRLAAATLADIAKQCCGMTFLTAAAGLSADGEVAAEAAFDMLVCPSLLPISISRKRLTFDK